MTTRTSEGGGDAQAVKQPKAQTSGKAARLDGTGRAAVIVNLGIDEPVRRVYNNGTTTTNSKMRRVWAACIPADEYAHLIALLRGEPPGEENP